MNGRVALQWIGAPVPSMPPPPSVAVEPRREAMLPTKGLLAALDGPRVMVPDEYDEVLEVMEQAFGFTRQHWLCQFPGVRRERFTFDDHFVTAEDGRVVGHVAVYPVPLVVDGATVMVGGIGSVATHPRYQGRGHFGRLMSHVNTVMRERGYPLAVLWGRTQRYRHFGYEPAGRKIVFHLRPPATSADSRLSVRGMDAERDLDWVIAAHELEPLRVERTRERYLELLTGASAQVWVGEGPDGRAYVALSDGDIVECGGDPACCAGVLSHLVRGYGHIAPDVSLPARDGQLTRLLYEASASWQIRPLASLKLLNLAETLRCFRHQIEAKLRYLGHEPAAAVTLTLAESGEQTSLRWDGSVSVEAGGGGEVVSLGERAMARLLFGPILENHGCDAATRSLLAAAFPLEFHVGVPDEV